MTHRNRALLDLCHEAPCLLLPGQHECLGAPSEPCHSDMIRHGRGEHHKSHDCFAVPGCHNAHLTFTQANLGKDGYHAAWTEAMERWILYLWVSGKIQLTAHPRAGKETSMEAPLCRICSHKHWAREPHQGLNPTKEEMRRAQPATAKPAGTAKPAKPCPALATAATKPSGSTSAKPKAPAGSTRKGTKKSRKMIKKPTRADIERNVKTSSAIENPTRKGKK